MKEQVKKEKKPQVKMCVRKVKKGNEAHYEFESQGTVVDTIACLAVALASVAKNSGLPIAKVGFIAVDAAKDIDAMTSGKELSAFERLMSALFGGK